jgi:hypothetical protein
MNIGAFGAMAILAGMGGLGDPMLDARPVRRRDGWSQLISRDNGIERWRQAVHGETELEVAEQVAVLCAGDAAARREHEARQAELWEAERPEREARQAEIDRRTRLAMEADRLAKVHNDVVRTRQLGRLEARRERKKQQKAAKQAAKRR